MREQSVREMLDLGGQTALVTGGAMGIGAGIAARLAELGANVIVADKDAAAGRDTVKTLNEGGAGKASFIKFDVSKEESVKAMVAAAAKLHGGIDILVNNAGKYPDKTLSEITTKYFEDVIHTNLLGLIMCTKHVAKAMVGKGRGGRIINIGSVNSLYAGDLGMSVYTASKHAVWGFTRNVAKELAEHRIWVNAIAPGYIDTPGTAEEEKEDADKARKERQEYVKKIPMHRIGEPDDIGRVAVFLASPLADYVTGTIVVADGGMLTS